MRPEEADAAYLWDMLEACREVLGFVRGVEYEDFTSDRKLLLAVERGLEIIGEAAGRISPAWQSAHPGVPWKRIRGMRNMLAHEYGAVDHAIVFETVMNDLPALFAQLEKLLA